ncbi:MAG: diacylglycerol/polyprenol kinase family protein [Bdellovibrionia bacterium]
MELKKRSDLHLARKVWHMSGVFSMFLAYTFLPETVALTMLFVAWLLFVPLDFLRQYRPKLNEWVVQAFRPIMRETERLKLAGTTYLLSGVALLVLFFPRPIVSLAILFLAFADPIASFVGIKWGKDKIFRHKSIQGFMAAYVVCFLVTFVYLTLTETLVDHVLVIALFGGLIGALAELVPVAKLDDNFTLPLLSAIGLAALFYFFGFFPIVG